MGIDFTPLTSEKSYIDRYCKQPLASLRQRYDWIATEHSGKLYPKEGVGESASGVSAQSAIEPLPSSFFSPQMLFARPPLSTTSICHVFSIFTQYASVYLELLAQVLRRPHSNAFLLFPCLFLSCMHYCPLLYCY